MKNPNTFKDMNKEFQYLWKKYERDDWKKENLGDYCANLEYMIMNYLDRNKELNPIISIANVFFNNYDYIDQNKSQKEHTKLGPGGGLFDGKMDKFKSVKEFIDADRKKIRNQRKKKLANLISIGTLTIDIPEDTLYDGYENNDEDEISVDNTINGIPFTNRVDPYPTYDSSFAQPVGQMFDNDQTHNSYYGLYSTLGSQINKTFKLAELYFNLVK